MVKSENQMNDYKQKELIGSEGFERANINDKLIVLEEQYQKVLYEIENGTSIAGKAGEDKTYGIYMSSEAIDLKDRISRLKKEL